MDEQEKALITRGFNAGYMLEKLNPKLSQQLRDGIQGDAKDPFMAGFMKGAEEYNQESFFTQSPNAQENVHDLGLDNFLDNDLGKEMDGKDRGMEP